MKLLPAILLLFIFFSIADLHGQDQVKRIYTTVHVEKAPKIDGLLDEQCWQAGKWDGDFTQQIPNSGYEPSQETFVKVLYDHENIYVAIRCMDTEPDKIRPIFNRRDEFAGDVAGIAFDSYNDKQTAFEFNVTAAGQKIDLKHYGEGDHDKNWNAIWDAASSINSSGWVAELRIPFSQLRYNRGDQKVWGMHVWRWIDRYREESQWQLIPQDAPAMVFLFGELKGFENIQSSRQVEILPYVSGGMEYKGEQENPHVDKWQPKYNAGVDAKIGIGSNFTVDVTFNPDFGQIEADPSELNLTTYETYFREKRPFFLEGTEIFDYRIDRDRLFYSRRIGGRPSYYPDTEEDEYFEHPDNTTILGSIKLTGKTSNGLSIGVMNNVTSKEFGNIYSPSETRKIPVEPFTNYFAGRIKQELNDANTIFGASINYVTRQQDEDLFQQYFSKNAITGGVDFTQYFDTRNYFITGKMAASHLTGSEDIIAELQESHLHRFDRDDAEHLVFDTSRTSLSGMGGTLRMGKQGGQFQYGAKLSFWSPQFNINDIGFARISDKVEQQAWVRYESIESSGIFRKYSIELDNKINTSFGKEITANEFGFESHLQFRNMWSMHFFSEMVLPSYDTRELRGGPALMQDAYAGFRSSLSTNTSKNLYGYLYGGYWHSLYTPTNYYSYGAGVHYNPFNRLSLDLDVSFRKNYDTSQYIESIENGADNDIIYLSGTMDRNILTTTLRAEYYLTPELSIQYYGSPYFSVGSFTEFKRVENPDAKEQVERFYFYGEKDYSYDALNEIYAFSEKEGQAFSVENPDFSFAQFRSNLILRWEYKLGSVFYFVWSHEQTVNEMISKPLLTDSFSDLFKSLPDDVIMIKFNYWLSM